MTRSSLFIGIILAIIGVVLYVLISTAPFQPEPQIPFSPVTPTP